MPLDYDVLIVGAGFGGIYMLHKMQNELKLKCKVIESLSGPGGTWQANRYPGAMSDTEAHLYQYSWDHDLLKEWQWKDKYTKQHEILSYLEHVVDRYDLRRSMDFNTTLTDADWQDEDKVWLVKTSTGHEYRVRYLFNCLGVLATTNWPDIPDLDKFKGRLIHSGEWPEDLDLTNKRVAVMGNGSTGVQIITAIAPKVKSLTCFQRHPQYSVPAQDGPTDPKFREEVDRQWPEIWHKVKNSAFGFSFTESQTPCFSVSEEERQKIYQAAWERGGGFNFLFGTFGDLALDEKANETACEFVRSKIRSIVQDPEKARKLQPHDLYARRPLMDAGYYERFNQDNVDIVLTPENPIEKFVENGIQTADGKVHEIDFCIFATGFDAVEGSYNRVRFRGKGGLSLKDKWEEQPVSYLGVAEADFPNMFFILGPLGAFANIPPCIEIQVEFLTQLIQKAECQATIETSEEAEQSWIQLCNELAKYLLFSRMQSWIFGANTKARAGKSVNKFYLGGIARYRGELEKAIAENWKGFTFSQA